MYGGFAYVQPDWGLDGVNNKGFTFGGTYTRYLILIGRPFGLGLDVRYNHSNGATVSEGAFTGNAQISTHVIGKLRAYGTVGYGYGTIKFNYVIPEAPSYTQDNGPILAGGAGLTYDVSRNFAAKVDYQFQNWSLGQNETINPSVYTFGVQYRIPFGAWTGHGHESD